MKFKLLERRAKARQTIGKLEEGVADVDEAVAALEKANLAQEKRDGKKAELQRFGVESTSHEMILELFVVVVLCCFLCFFCVVFFCFVVSRESYTSQVEKRTLHRLVRGWWFKGQQSKTIGTPPARRKPKISNLQ